MTLKSITGHSYTLLIVLRGNSASGKTSLAREVRRRIGQTTAMVSQDMVRRDILQEHDMPTGVHIGMIDAIARHALDRGYHVIVEGILGARSNGAMLEKLVDDHAGRSCCFYLDVSWEETLRRHATKPEAAEFGEEMMRQWFKPLDLLPQVVEHRLPENLSLAAMVDLVIQASGLAPAGQADT